MCSIFLACKVKMMATSRNPWFGYTCTVMYTVKISVSYISDVVYYLNFNCILDFEPLLVGSLDP